MCGCVADKWHSVCEKQTKSHLQGYIFFKPKSIQNENPRTNCLPTCLLDACCFACIWLFQDYVPRVVIYKENGRQYRVFF